MRTTNLSQIDCQPARDGLYLVSPRRIPSGGGVYITLIVVPEVLHYNHMKESKRPPRCLTRFVCQFWTDIVCADGAPIYRNRVHGA